MMTSAPISADATKASAKRQRLDRLENYLRQDPTNQALLIDAFENALECGDWDRARFHLGHGQSLQSDALGWRLREGDFWLAQQRFDEARAVLESLQQMSPTPPGFADVLAHNLAFVDLRQGRSQDGIARLERRMETEGSHRCDDLQQRNVHTALSQLWLRLLHHGGQIDRALRWARAAEAVGALPAPLAGIASLIAVDAGDFDSALRWSAFALENEAAGAAMLEVLVARGSLALAARDAAQAKSFASAALQRNHKEGRAWSLLGFAELLAGNLEAASEAFVQGTRRMPEHVGTWHGAGWTQILQNRLDDARKSFETALAKDRNFAESHGALAVVLAMLGRAQEAQAQATLALKLEPDNLSGRYAQALMAGEVSDSRSLRRLAQRLLGGRHAPLGGDLGTLFEQSAAGDTTPRIRS